MHNHVLADTSLTVPLPGNLPCSDQSEDSDYDSIWTAHSYRTASFSRKILVAQTSSPAGEAVYHRRCISMSQPGPFTSCVCLSMYCAYLVCVFVTDLTSLCYVPITAVAFRSGSSRKDVQVLFPEEEKIIVEETRSNGQTVVEER